MTDQLTIDEIIQTLSDNYPALFFSKHGVWCKRIYKNFDGTTEERDGTAIAQAGEWNIYKIDHEKLKQWNFESHKVMENDDKMFFCTTCKKAHANSELYGQVFCGKYCKACAQKDAGIRGSVKDASRPGFYN